MLSKNNRSQNIHIARHLLVAGLALLFALIFSSSHVHAQQRQPAKGPSILSVKAGFNGTYRTGNWIPVQVKVNNDGNEFNGLISVSLSSTYTGNSPSPTGTSIYQTAISLPALSQKQVTMYVPIEELGNGQGKSNSLTIHLQDNNNHEITKQSATITSIEANKLYLGLISDQTLDIRQLTAALSGQNASTRVEPLTASALPTAVEAFKNFDLLILDNATINSLGNDQFTALQGWVNQGGILVEVGGPEWHKTLSTLPTSLLPVTITGTDKVTAGQHLLLQDGKNANDTLSIDVPVSVATPKPGSLVLLASNNIPLIVQANMGQGLIYYLAYDPFLAPLVNWTNTNNLWNNLLLRSLGDQILTINNPNATYTSLAASKANLNGIINGFLESLVPNVFPSIWLILALLVSYILILGPLRFLLIRWSKQKAWSWRIVIATIIVFSLLSYGLALQVKGTSVVSSTVSLLQLSSPDGTRSQAHVTDYLGVYVPSQGNFHVHIPGTRLVGNTDQASLYGAYGPSGQSSSVKTAITTQATSTDVDLQGMDTWTLRALATKYDTHIQGGITSNLSLSKDTITGTVTNTLPYSLHDAYLLVGNNYASLGNLARGQTKSVQLVGLGLPPTQPANNGEPDRTLADQIAISKGININQYSTPSLFNSNQLPDENHRHAALLEALSGGNCNTGFCFRNYSYTAPVAMGPSDSLLQPHLLDGPVRGYSQDPLLMTGAPATIIGWINNPSDLTQITINNATVSGTQEILLQAPLNLHFTGAVDIPPALSTVQVVDVQPGPNTSNWPQTISPGTYSLTTGSITFEIQLPVTGNFQGNDKALPPPSLTFNQSTTVLGKSAYANQAQGPTNDVNTMNVGLYNWQTNSWDGKTFNANILTVDNAQLYINAGGRVLIRFANDPNAQSTAVFATPDAALHATIAG